MRFVLLALLSTTLIYAKTNIEVEDNDLPKTVEEPWLTGPLLTASPHVVPVGHFNLEPYLFVNNDIGYLNNHWHLQRFSNVSSNINFQFFAQIGLTPWMDMSIIPQFFYNYKEMESSWRFGDFLMGLDFQLSPGNYKKRIPSVKFTINELFPTGQYQHLKASNLGTDSSGGGSFATTFQMVFGHHMHFYSVHFLAARLSAAAILFSQVSVHGINSYGGDSSTVGRVFPGTAFPVLLGLEYTMTQNWALALDVASTFTCKSRFKGTTIAPVGTNTWSYSLSFAPAIEFNYTVNVGLIAGVWVTAFGRNTPNFINYVIALNWYI